MPKHLTLPKPPVKPSDPDKALREVLILRDMVMDAGKDGMSTDRFFRTMNPQQKAKFNQESYYGQNDKPEIYDDCAEADPEGCIPRPVFFGEKPTSSLQDQLIQRQRNGTN